MMAFSVPGCVAQSASQRQEGLKQKFDSVPYIASEFAVVLLLFYWSSGFGISRAVG